MKYNYTNAKADRWYEEIVADVGKCRYISFMKGKNIRAFPQSSLR